MDPFQNVFIEMLLNILKVIFLESNPLRFIETLIPFIRGLFIVYTGRGVVLAKKQFSPTVSFSVSAREFPSDFFTIIK